MASGFAGTGIALDNGDSAEIERNDKKPHPNQKKGEERGGGNVESSASVESGQGVLYRSDLDADTNQMIQNNGCSWYWVHGHVHYGYSNFWLYTEWNSYASTRATIGTSGGSCGVPLNANFIYVGLTEHLTDHTYAGFSNQANNTSFIDRGNNGSRIGGGYRACGVSGSHVITHNGVTVMVNTSTSSCDYY